MSWQESYDDDHTSSLCEHGLDDESLEAWQITFEHDGDVYYCFVYAHNLNEALGTFFKEHDNISYDRVIAHEQV